MGIMLISRWPFFVRFTASITLIAFLFTSIPVDYAWSYPAAVNPPSNEIAIDKIQIPAYMGYIRDSYTALRDNSPIIIHIQDAHCNYAAENAIFTILDYINTKYGVSQINLEGGEAGYDMTSFSAIKDAELRRKTADYIMKEGEINGAEFYAINNPGKMSLWGVEDAALYLDNLNVYRDSLKHKDESGAYIQQLNNALAALKTKMYPPKLLELDRRRQAFKDGSLEFKDYIAYLNSAAGDVKADSSDLANIAIVNKALLLEKGIDFKLSNSERDQLMDYLSKSLSKNEVKELVQKTVELSAYTQLNTTHGGSAMDSVKAGLGGKLGHIQPAEFYSYLFGKARELKIDLSEYKNLNLYVGYITAYAALKKEEIFKEIDALETRTEEKLYENDDQRELARLSKGLFIIKDLLGVTLTREEFDFYRNNRKNFNADNFSRFIARLAPKCGMKITLNGDIEKLDSYVRDMERFYTLSYERDSEFVKNIRFGGKDRKIAVLVTSGFHTDNLTGLLKKKGISYISIMPSFGMDGAESLYFKLLGGNYSPLFKFILANTSSLAIWSLLNENAGKVYGTSKKILERARRDYVSVKSELLGDGKSDIHGIDLKKIYSADELPKGGRLIEISLDGNLICAVSRNGAPLVVASQIAAPEIALIGSVSRGGASTAEQPLRASSFDKSSGRGTERSRRASTSGTTQRLSRREMTAAKIVKEVGGEIGDVERRIVIAETTEMRGKEVNIAPLRARRGELAWKRLDEIDRLSRDASIRDADILRQIELEKGYLVKAMVDGDSRIAELVSDIKQKQADFKVREALEYMDRPKTTQRTRMEKFTEAAVGITDATGPAMVKIINRRNKLAKDYGYENYADIVLRASGLTAEDVSDLADAIRKDTQKDYDSWLKNLKRTLRARYKHLRGKEIYYTDMWLPLGDGEKALHAALPREEIKSFSEKFLADMGVGIEKLMVKRYEDGIWYAIMPVEPGKRVNMVVPLDGAAQGIDIASVNIHESLHAFHFSNIDHNQLAIYRYGDAVFLTGLILTEAIAMFGQKALMQPETIKGLLKEHYRGWDEKKLDKEVRHILDQDRKKEIASTRRIAGLTKFELWLYRQDKELTLEDIRKKYGEIWVEFVEIKDTPSRREEDRGRTWGRNMILAENPMYQGSYMFGSKIADAMLAKAKRDYGKAADPRVAKEMILPLIHDGSRRLLDDRLKDVLGVSSKDITGASGEARASVSGAAKPDGSWYNKKVAISMEELKKSMIKNHPRILELADAVEEATNGKVKAPEIKSLTVEDYINALEYDKKVSEDTDLSPKKFEEEMLKFYFYMDESNNRVRGTWGYHDAAAAGKVRRIIQKMFREKSKVARDPVRYAAEAFVAITKAQAFFDGNHRVADFVLNFILVKNGYRYFMITPANVVEYYYLLNKENLYDGKHDLNQITEFFRKQVSVAAGPVSPGAVSRASASGIASPTAELGRVVNEFLAKNPEANTNGMRKMAREAVEAAQTNPETTEAVLRAITYITNIYGAIKEILSNTRFPEEERTIFIPISEKFCPANRIVYKSKEQAVWKNARDKLSKQYSFSNITSVFYDGTEEDLAKQIAARPNLNNKNALAYVGVDMKLGPSLNAKVTVVKEDMPEGAEGAYVSIGGHVILALGILDLVRNERKDREYVSSVARLIEAISNKTVSADSLVNDPNFIENLKKGDFVITLPAIRKIDIDDNMNRYFVMEEAAMTAL